IHPADLHRTIGLLADHGFVAAPNLSWLSTSALLRWTGEISYTSPQASIDLHWRLTPSHYPIQLDPEILWRNQATIELAGSTLPSLAQEALLVLLSVHGAKHGWECIGWLADIAWLLDSNPHLKWPAAKDLAAETHCEYVVALAESLVNTVF